MAAGMRGRHCVPCVLSLPESRRCGEGKDVIILLSYTCTYAFEWTRKCTDHQSVRGLTVDPVLVVQTRMQMQAAAKRNAQSSAGAQGSTSL